MATLVAAGSAACCLLLLEAYFRIVPSTDYQTNNEYSYRQYFGSGQFGIPFYSWQERFPQELDSRSYFEADEYLIRYEFNQFGARWIRRDYQPIEEKIALVVGDSFTYGSAVRYPDTYVYKIQQRLNDVGRNVTLLNFARSGADSQECLDIYKALRGTVDHNVLFYGLHLNDVISFGTSYILRNEDLTRWYVRYSKLAGFVAKRLYNYSGRRRKIQELTDMAVFDQPFFRDNLNAIIEMKRLAEQDDVAFYVIILPILIELREETFKPIYEGIEARLSASGVEYLDLTSTVTSFSDSSLWVLPVDQHPNEIAHDLFASSLFDQIEARGVFQ